MRKYLEVGVFRRGGVTLGSNQILGGRFHRYFKDVGGKRNSPTAVGVGKLEGLAFHVISKYR